MARINLSYTRRFNSYRAVKAASRLYKPVLYRETIAVCTEIRIKHSVDGTEKFLNLMYV